MRRPRTPRWTVDFETRSEVELSAVGVWRYAEDPSTEVLCLGYKSPKGKKGCWYPGQTFPAEIIQAVEDGELFEAHNAQFERAIWLHKFTHVCPMPRRWADTMAMLAQRAMPLKLEEAGKVLDLPVQKDKEGKAILNKVSKPRKPNKQDKELFKILGLAKHEWPTLWNEDPELYKGLYKYCETDAEAEESVSHHIGDLTPYESSVFRLDQIINQRGVAMDLEGVDAAMELAEKKNAELEAELCRLTDHKVTSGGQRDRIIAFLREHDYHVANMRGESVKSYIADPYCPEICRQVLQVRQKLARASTKKLKKIKICTSADGRARGMLQYCGAGRNGRFSGRLIQPQNLIRTELDTELLVGTIKKRDLELLEMIYGDASDALAESLRGYFIAGEGRDLISVDFDQIEARVLAWLAGEDWKLEAFRRGDPIYEKVAELIFGYPVTKATHPLERHAGKTGELAFGYGGGVGAWRGFDNSDMHTDEDVNKYKRLWRERNSRIVGFWYGLEDAAKEALLNKKPVACGPVVFDVATDRCGHWMTCRLPSGRKIWYFDPELRWCNSPIGRKLQVTYQGRDNHRGGMWCRVKCYGGKFAEHVASGTARDLMVHGMLQVEKHGYPVVLTVHDEVVGEPKENFGSVSEFSEIMTDIPDWAKGCPVTAGGWRGKRYRK